MKTLAPIPLPIALYRTAQRQVDRRSQAVPEASKTKETPPRNSVTAGKKIDLVV
jgi:hypothetical protein